MGKKSKKSKKNVTHDLADCTDAAPTGVDNSFKLKEDNEKKIKKKHVVGGDIELDSICEEALNGKGNVEVDGDLQKEKGQKNQKKKKKKMKRILDIGEDVTDCADAPPTGVENKLKLCKEEKATKNQKKHEVRGDIILDDIRDKALCRKGYAEDHGLQMEKDQKKNKMKTTKKRKLESREDKDTLSHKTQMEGEEKRGMQINDGMDTGNDRALKPRKDKKKWHEDHEKKNGSNAISLSMEILEGEDTGNDEVVKGKKSFERDGTAEIENGEGGAKEKNKNNTGRRDTKDSDVKRKKKTKDWKAVEISCDEDVMEKVEKKRKREKKKDKVDLAAGLQEILIEESGNESLSFNDKDLVDNEGNAHSSINKKQDIESKNANISKRKKIKSVENGSENPKPKSKSKRVAFSGHVEVFPSPDDPSTGKEKNQEDNIVRGKRFSIEEDEVVKEAVLNYIAVNNLGEEGLKMILNCRYYPQVKNCWKEIGAAIPYRPYVAVYYRAHILFERGGEEKSHTWTEEEYDLIRKSQKKHGNNWKMLAEELGKHRFHVKDTWRRIKLPNLKKGRWSLEEYQTLFDLVNKDLQMKAYEEKISKHGMLRDNICWGAISDKLSTRIGATCCEKWYTQLTSSMVVEGIWANADDYRLLDALFNFDACCIEDVDWDNLLKHRSGDVCRKRWDQMVRHIPQHVNKSFAEKVEILAKRYCSDLLEAREAWDNKPFVR